MSLKRLLQQRDQTILEKDKKVSTWFTEAWQYYILTLAWLQILLDFL